MKFTATQKGKGLKIELKILRLPFVCGYSHGFKYKLSELQNSVLIPANLEVREKLIHRVWNISVFKINRFTIPHVLQELHKTGLVSKLPPEIQVISSVSLVAACPALISILSQSSTEVFSRRSHKPAPDNGLGAKPTGDRLNCCISNGTSSLVTTYEWTT